MGRCFCHSFYPFCCCLCCLFALLGCLDRAHGSPFCFPGCPHGLECLLFLQDCLGFHLLRRNRGSFHHTGRCFHCPVSGLLDRFLCFWFDLDAPSGSCAPFLCSCLSRCSTASCFAVQRGYNGFSLPLLFYLLISFHCQLLSTMIGDRSAFLSSPLFRPFYPVSSVFHRRFLSGFSSYLVCHHPGLLFRFQHGRTHQFFGKPGGRIADLRVLIPYLLFDVFQTHTSLYHITVPYSVSFVSSAVLPAFPVPLPLPAPTDDWHNREHRTITLFPSPR